MSCPQCGVELEDYSSQEGGWCPKCKVWFPIDVILEFGELDDEYDEEEGGLCGEWMSFGTEECEFCPHADLCRELTLEAMKSLLSLLPDFSNEKEKNEE